MAQRRKYALLASSIYEVQRHILDTDKDRNYKNEMLRSFGTIAFTLASLELSAKTAAYIGGRWWTKIAAPIFALEAIYLGGSWISYQIGGDEGTAQFNNFLHLAVRSPEMAIQTTIQSIVIITNDPEGTQKVAEDVVTGYEVIAEKYEPLTDAIGLTGY